MVKPLSVIGAQTLMELPLPPTIWLVEDLIATGSTIILASRPKIGKSWLVLQLGHCVANGIPFLEHKTTKAGVVYLALEDLLKRLQSRLWSLTDESSDDLRLVIRAETLDNGLIEQMKKLLNEDPSIKLFIVDTLQVTRNQTADYSYANDYADLRKFKDFADKNNVCCLLVHHLRKANSQNDDMLDISGTSAISGAVDSMMVLKKRNRADSEAKLSIEGRDVEYTELILQRENAWWTLKEALAGEEAKKSNVSKDVREVAKFIYAIGDSWRGSATELLAQLQFDELTAPVLGKHLAQFSDYLAELGISYSTKRTSSERFIMLDFNPSNDSSDSNDGSL